MPDIVLLAMTAGLIGPKLIFDHFVQLSDRSRCNLRL